MLPLDRLGRSLSGVIRMVEMLTERGVLLRSLRDAIDYFTPMGRMLLRSLRDAIDYFTPMGRMLPGSRGARGP